MAAEAERRAPVVAARPRVCATMKDHTLGLVCVFIVRVSYSRTSRGGNSSIGCIDRYAAKERASMKVMLAPWEAFAMAVKMKRVVKDDVDRAMHVATVKGLNRKLCVVNNDNQAGQYASYPAATARLLHRRSFRDDMNNLVTTACPLSATCASALALKRSTTVYSRFVASGALDGFGRSEKSGSRTGAWWYMPPSYGETLCV